MLDGGGPSTSRHSDAQYSPREYNAPAELAEAASSEQSDDAPVKLVDQHWEWLSKHYPAAFLFYHNVSPSYQYGRDCGFVALAMAASIVQRRLDVARMITWSRRKGFTNMGEMFDVRNLKTVCDRFLERPSTVMPFPDKDNMVADLVRGRVYLVPYDAGRVLGRPVNRNGIWAHWVLVFGVLLLRPDSPHSLERLTKLSTDRPIYRGDLQHFFSSTDTGLEYLLTQHGWKPCEPDIWPYEDLHQSCMQLNCIDPYIAWDCVIPEGGIRKGLRGKVLRLEL